VIPVRARPVDDEAVGELAADGHPILGDSGDAVHGVRDIDAVPVQADAGSDRDVPEVRLDELPDHSADRRAR